MLHNVRDTLVLYMIKTFFWGNKEIRLPVIQGGMGVGISLSGLAAAVANEGGIGVISSAGLGLLYKHSPADYLKESIWGLKEELRKTLELTKGSKTLPVPIVSSARAAKIICQKWLSDSIYLPDAQKMSIS